MKNSKVLEIVRCPFCKSSLKAGNGFFACVNHGAFKKDRDNRLFLIDEKIFVSNSKKQALGINWLKSFFKKSPKFYYFIWHTICPVMMLINGPKMILKYVKRGAVVVNIGSGPDRIGEEFINVDIYPFLEVDIVADATKLPFGDNSIDALVSESVFEHISEASEVGREMMRVLKPGGYVYISAPFIHPYHASPDDFNRWTLSGLKNLLPGTEIVRSGVRSGPWSALLMFLAYWLGVVFCFGFKKLAPFLAHVFMIIFGPFKYLDYFFMKMPGSEVVAAHLYILAKKNER